MDSHIFDEIKTINQSLQLILGELRRLNKFIGVENSSVDLPGKPFSLAFQKLASLHMIDEMENALPAELVRIIRQEVIASTGSLYDYQFVLLYTLMRRRES